MIRGLSTSVGLHQDATLGTRGRVRDTKKAYDFSLVPPVIQSRIRRAMYIRVTDSPDPSSSSPQHRYEAEGRRGTEPL